MIALMFSLQAQQCGNSLSVTRQFQAGQLFYLVSIVTLMPSWEEDYEIPRVPVSSL